MPYRLITFNISMKLPAQWTIYEKYFTENKKNYQASFVKILSFDSIPELSFLKKQTIYLKPMQIFYEHQTQKIKVFNRFTQQEDTKEEVVIDALFYFKYDIKPEWEDARNKNGGEI